MPTYRIATNAEAHSTTVTAIATVASQVRAGAGGAVGAASGAVCSMVTLRPYVRDGSTPIELSAIRGMLKR